MHTAFPFNVADIVAAVFVLACILLGFKRGLIGQIAPIVGLGVIAAAVHFGFGPCREALAARLELDAAALNGAALAIVVAVPVVVLLLLRKLVGKVTAVPVLSGLDRLGGALAGLFVGLLVVLIVFVTLRLLPARFQSAVFHEESWIGRQVDCLGNTVKGTVSESVDRTEDAILKARQNRAGRREQWEQ